MRLEKLIFFLPAIIWALLIYYLSSQPVLPGLAISGADFLFKKMAHIFVYFVLYLLTWFGSSQNTTDNNARIRLMLPVFICLVYAVLDEIHQSFTPGRTPALRDVGFDSLGTFIGFLTIYRYV